MHNSAHDLRADSERTGGGHLTVGQITKNYIQQNSVGIGFFGYSGFSGWSGPAGGFQGWTPGAYLWIDDILVFDSLNGFYRYTAGRLHSCWDVFTINDYNNAVGPGAAWTDGISVSGFKTKVRARALVTPYWLWGVGTSGADFWAIRARKVNAYSYTNGYWAASMYSYADNNMLITRNGRYTFWGPAGSAASMVYTGTPVDGTGNYADMLPSIIETPWVDLPGDGFYIVEVYDWFLNGTYGFMPDKIFLEFAKVKD